MYPSPFIIKNTFIDGEVARPCSFDEFFRQRETLSCPASKVCAAVNDVADDALTDHSAQDRLERQDRLFVGEMPSKNTFVHFPVEPPSLDFLVGRQAKSCPSSGVEMADGEGRGQTPEDTVVHDPVTPAREDDELSFAPVWECGMDMGMSPDAQDLYFPFAFMPMEEQFVPEQCVPEQFVPEQFVPEQFVPEQFVPEQFAPEQFVPEQFMPLVWHEMEQIQQPLEEIQQLPRAVLSLASALPEPEMGSPEMPTIGSEGHWNGTCRPCAFMARGCTSGISCPFCHLCDPCEKKRRRKDKIAFMRELRRWKKEQVVSSPNGLHT